jgi:hypothetical protein
MSFLRDLRYLAYLRELSLNLSTITNVFVANTPSTAKDEKSLISLNSRQKQNLDDKLRNRSLAAICIDISRTFM